MSHVRGSGAWADSGYGCIYIAYREDRVDGGDPKLDGMCGGRQCVCVCIVCLFIGCASVCVCECM